MFVFLGEGAEREGSPSNTASGSRETLDFPHLDFFVFQLSLPRPYLTFRFRFPFIRITLVLFTLAKVRCLFSLLFTPHSSRVVFLS